jgi:hypothetical protein
MLLSISLTGCKKDESPAAFKLQTMTAGDIDLNGATAPGNVPVSPTITAVFSNNVDETTATSSNITLVQDYDKSNINIDITVDGKTVTIMPSDPLGNGALYKLSFGAGLKDVNGQMIEPFDRSFNTEGTFVPSGQVAYFNFENNANDQMGNYDPISDGVIDITYTTSHNSAAGMAAQFNGNTSLIEIPNGDQLMNTNDFSLSFWVKADSTQHGQFVMGLAGWNGFQFEIAGDYGSCKLAAQYEFADGTSGSEDLWFPGNGQTKDNGGWQGWTFCKDLTNSGGVKELLAAKWANVVCVYNSTTKVGTMYINGEKMKAQDFNLWPDGDPKQTVTGLKYNGDPQNNVLALGFIQDKNNPTIGDGWADYSNPDNNHFKGLLDDVSIYHKVLSETEIQLMYNSGKP